jgi:hypothetical protein
MSTATKCRAQGGAKKCTDPNCPEKRAQAARMAAFYNHPAAAPKGSKGPKSIAMIRALNAKLGWQGEKPTWWAEFESTAQNHPDFPETPELLDVIDSPAGKVAVVWQNESQEARDKAATLDTGIGLYMLYYKSVETGETLGYLRLTKVDDESLDRAFGTDEFMPFRFRENFGGHSYGLDYDEFHEGESNRNLSGQALLDLRRKMWYRAMRAHGKGCTTESGEHIAYYALSERHTPASDERIKQDLDELAASILPEIAQHRKAYQNPTPDYSRLKEAGPLAGQGYGTAMYIYAARKLGESGRMLRASGAQSPDAKALWARFEKLMPERVKPIKVKHRGGSVDNSRALDFRSRKRAGATSKV